MFRIENQYKVSVEGPDVKARCNVTRCNVTISSRDLFILPYLRYTTMVRIPYLQLKSLKTDQIMNVNMNTQSKNGNIRKYVTDTND